MSASPANGAVSGAGGASSGGLNGSPNGTPGARAPKMRRRPQANPLVDSRKVRKMLDKPSKLPAPRPSPAATSPAPPAKPSPMLAESSEPVEPPGEPTMSIPVFASKRDLLDGLRFHAMRLISKEKVDILDDTKFPKPIRLHRRDTRAPQVSMNGDDADSKDGILDDKEREKLEMQKAERKRIREENLAQIAPTAKSHRSHPFQKKTEQVYRTEDTPEQKKKSQLRYEEALPWHLEDFDGKSTWVGHYEEALSDKNHIILQKFENAGTPYFKAIPLEKWYRFTSKPKVKHMTTEEAEQRMNKKYKDPRWIADKRAAEEKRARDAFKFNTLSTRNAGRGDEERPAAYGGPVPAADIDELDMDGDVPEFADDEENPLFEGEEEDKKFAEDKMRRDHLQANTFGDLKYDEAKLDEEEELEELKKKEEKRLQKQTIRNLKRNEKNYDYDVDDSDRNPYETSESDDSEAERLREEEEQRKKAEAEAEAGKSTSKDDNQTGSGASTKGTTTPSGRIKHVDALKKSSKRAGSPNLSEASGNESARKKQKKKHIAASGTETGLSRPSSPANDTSSLRKPTNLGEQPRQGTKRSAASGSDTEATDASKRPRKLKATSARGTPPGSRAGSPAPPSALSQGAGTVSSNGVAQGQGARPAQPTPRLPFPSREEIQKAIGPDGILLDTLKSSFAPRIQGKERQQAFVEMVKKVAKYNKATKTLSLK